ncbi:hypothetical protein PVAND_011187 [Polypedilum vanderplanki]|uniref:Galectin n=1 Tax=Polypedilum vanderplanki TaxID=319348 RepID=A0A9J6CJ70_POLVA|nr:hypothetical protein PVAND_011187 [Polypedilum vanderplanki]
MENCLKTVNNCLDIFTSCIPKDTNNSNNSTAVNNPNNNSSYKLPKMSYYTLHLPTRPKVDDEIRIKAKLKERPKEFIINLCVDSALKPDDDEAAMIAFHFRTKFKGHPNDRSYVVLNCKRGLNGWDEIEEIENSWIDDDAEEIEISLKFAKREIQFISGESVEYQFEHQYEIQRIDRLQIGGDLDYIEEVALRYRKK